MEKAIIKTVAFMPRRADVSRSAFRDYYEERHAPLALNWFPFRKYVRNHLLDHEDIGFDSLSEFWVSDLGETARLMDSEVGETMRADERNFLDQPAIVSVRCDEVLVKGTARGVDPAPTPKGLWFLHSDDDADSQPLISALAAIDAPRVTVDLLSRMWGAAPPYAAIVSIWSDADGPPASVQLPAGWRAGPFVRADACETPPERLRAIL